MSRYRTNTKKPINRKKKYREGGPVGEPVMLDEVDVVAPKFKPKGLFKGLRERFARNTFPFSYNSSDSGDVVQRLGRSLILNKPEKKELLSRKFNPGSHVAERKALLDLSMGVPVRDEAIGALSVSDYRPSSSTDNDSVYLRSKATEEEIIDMYFSRGQENVYWLNERLKESDGKFHAMAGSVLGNYTLSRGEDENGTYISYYDIWDLNPTDNIPGLRDVVDGAQSLVGVNAPEVYGRIYVDTDDEGNITGYKDKQPRKSKRYRNETKKDQQER